MITLLLLMVVFGIKIQDTEHFDNQIVTGKNKFDISVNGDLREVYLHIPKKYNEKNSHPVVIMLHGSGTTGLKFYEDSGWKEVSEKEKFIAVFPTAWKYCVIDEGRRKFSNKWNTPGSFDYCRGVTPKNDVLFINTLIVELAKKLNIDKSRIYIAGFSNGASMSTKCIFELPDVFAAACANGGFQLESNIFPDKYTPLLVQTGERDKNLVALLGEAIPMNIEQAFKIPEVNNLITNFKRKLLLEDSFETFGSEKSINNAVFNGLSGHPNHKFVFSIIKGAGHIYPNGNNHPVRVAELQWKWMSQFTK